MPRPEGYYQTYRTSRIGQKRKREGIFPSRSINVSQKRSYKKYIYIYLHIFSVHFGDISDCRCFSYRTVRMGDSYGRIIQISSTNSRTRGTEHSETRAIESSTPPPGFAHRGDLGRFGGCGVRPSQDHTIEARLEQF